MNTNFLDVQKLCFSYPDNMDVISSVTFNIKKDEKIALIGPNGSGKTTLFMLLCGILKPITGHIQINNSKIKPHKFNPGVAYLFQSPEDQLFSSTIYDDIAFGPINMGLPKEKIIKQINKALNATNTTSLSDRPPHHLSGGEKRMAALATILAMQPDIILFDEPTSNLDSNNRRQVISTIHSLNTTMLIASHDLEFLLETCTKVIILNKGKITEYGRIKEIMSDESIMKKHSMEKPHSLVNHIHCGHEHIK